MLPEWIDPGRALHRLEKILAERGMTQEANDMLAFRGKPQHLPGFNVFSRGASISPFEWCVPRPRNDEADVINAYEAYVDRSLGLVPHPGAAAYDAVGRGACRRYFGPKRTPGRWRIPLVKLVAVGQHAAGEVAYAGRDRVELSLPSGRLMVTRRGAFSNFRGHVVQAKRIAVDTGFEEVSVASIRTAHPLASYLSGRVEDDVLWLANVVIQGERFGLIPAIQFQPPAAKPTPRRRKTLAVDVLGAALTCQELLTTGPRENLVPALYSAAVPALMTSRYFKRHFGVPYGAKAGRLVSTRLREEWRHRIDAIVEDLQTQR